MLQEINQYDLCNKIYNLSPLRKLKLFQRKKQKIHDQEHDNFLKDSICGAFSGVSMILSAYPLDTIKTRLQMNSGKLIPTTKEIFYKEGFTSFYKGMSPVLITSTFLCSAVFATYEFCKRTISSLYNFSENQTLAQTFTQALVSGAFAGFVQSFVVSPIELIKCNLQMQYEFKPKQYKDPIAFLKYLIQKEGIKGVYKGLVPTNFRDVPQYATFFAAYDILKYFSLKGSNEEHLDALRSFLIGGFAGQICIMASYPQDLIKTKIQCESSLPVQQRKFKPQSKIFRDGGFARCAKGIYREQGLKGFWLGFSSCSLLFIISSAAQFQSYELAQYYYKKIIQNRYSLY